MIVDNFDIMYSLSMCVGVVCALDFYDFFYTFFNFGYVNIKWSGVCQLNKIEHVNRLSCLYF